MASFTFLLLLTAVLLLSVEGFVSQLSNKRSHVVLHSSTEADITPTQVYMDLEIGDTPIGRLVFSLCNPSPLPLHTENLVTLLKGSRRSIDPLAHYVGCTFDFSPATIEDGLGRYRWGHVCKGRGRNAIGRPDEPIVDAENLLKSTHSCFGGQYYGQEYQDQEVVLTVPVAGPGRGSSRFSVVRVGESPPEWKERLLLNSGVVGTLEPTSLEVLHTMARQQVGPPKIVASGVL